MALIMHIKDVGHLKFELFVDDAPLACKNFLALCASDFYTGTKFHRNIRGFILQGGDPSGSGKHGNSIYDDKPFKDEINTEVHKHDKRGILSMANSGPNKNLS